jgi:hypothetical protein
MRNGPPGEDSLAEEDEAFSSCEDPRGADENIFPKNDMWTLLKGALVFGHFRGISITRDHG